MTDFATQSVQFAWFVSDTTNLVADGLMQNMLDLQPDTVQTNRVPSPEAPFLSSAVRAEGKFKFILNVSPGRVDLYVQPQVDGSSPTLPLIDAREGITLVLDALRRNSPVGLTSVYRCAVVCIFLDREESSESANTAFARKVGIPAVHGAIDQNFTINVRKRLPEAICEVNRILHYSVDKIQQMEVMNLASGRFDVNNGRVVAETYFIRTAIDVNNIPEEQIRLDDTNLHIYLDQFSKELIALKELDSVSEIS
jgi:hypothetical protein